MTDTIHHGTSVSLEGKGILICGRSGAGKSSLALQLIDRGAILIADDQTRILQENGELILQPLPSHKGLLEVRGVGICSFPHQEEVSLSLWVELCDGKDVERLPEPAFTEYNGISVPLLKIKENDPLGGIKIAVKVGLYAPPSS